MARARGASRRGVTGAAAAAAACSAAAAAAVLRDVARNGNRGPAPARARAAQDGARVGAGDDGRRQ
jgi:hypothetical protein